MRYSIEPKDRTYIKGYGYLFFLKNTDKNLSIKYGQKHLDTKKKLATDAHKSSSKRVIQKTAKATGDLTGNKIIEKIAKAASENTREDPKTSAQSTEMPKEIFIPLERWQQILVNFDYYNHKCITRMDYQKMTNLLNKTNDQPSKIHDKKLG